MNEQMKDFGEFWSRYPRRVGKLAAIKAYAKARTQASAAEILAGVDRYVQHKPAYADFCFPATFLNQGRWLDEYDARPPVVSARTAALAASDAQLLRRLPS